MGTTVTDRLAEPFTADQIKFKPSVVRDNKALALAYIDARDVMQRLDDVLGIDGWWDEYEFHSEGCSCRLTCVIDGKEITKEDFGSESEQKSEGDRGKAAVSDALKRAAVKFGIGRHLYSLPAQWVGYDPKRKRLTETPNLPRQNKAPASTNGHAKPSKDDGSFGKTLETAIAELDKLGVTVKQIETMLGHEIEKTFPTELDKIRQFYSLKSKEAKLLDTTTRKDATAFLRNLDLTDLGHFAEQFQDSAREHLDKLAKREQELADSIF